MRRSSVLFTASVLLNLFLLGVLAGGAWWITARDPVIAAGSLRLAGAELSADHRRALRVALRETRRSMRDAIRTGRAARQDAADLLRQPAPDRPAVIAALDRVRRADFAVRTAIEQRAVALVVTLPAAERGRVADAMLRRAGDRAARNRR